MTELRQVSGTQRFLFFILIFLIVTDLAVLLDVPVLRPVLGFLFLTILPGVLVLQVLRVHQLGLSERLVLAAGLGVAFSMIIGLIVNSVAPLIGYTTPLSTISIVISFNIVFLILAALGYRRGPDFSFNLSRLQLGTKEKAFLLLPALFPLFSILGMRMINATGNNTLLIVLLSIIPAYVILVAVMHRKLNEQIYPALIVPISLSFVLLVGLWSNHIIGLDTHQEYLMFVTTLSVERWQILGRGILDSCLSISLLPAVYHSVLNLEPEHLFKILYPVLFSLSPLVVYTIARKYIGGFYAFLVSFLFISQSLFFWTATLARVNLALLFFLLAIMVLFHSNITELAKRTFFIIFTASTIASHYSTSYVFLFILLLTWLGMEIRLIMAGREKTPLPPENPTPEEKSQKPAALSSITALSVPFRNRITATTLALFFAVLFTWYAQVTGAPFSSAVEFVRESFVSLGQFAVVEARAPLVARAFGQELSYAQVPVTFKFVVNWLTIALIAGGILATIVQYKKVVKVSSVADKPAFLSSKIEVEYFVLSIVCCAVLAVSLVFPYISRGYGMERAYFQIIGILALFFGIGAIALARFLKLRPHWLMLLILIPFFVGNAGLVDQIFHRPTPVLNTEGHYYNDYYIHDQDSYAARWLRDNGDLKDTRIYTDGPGGDILLSQASIYTGYDTRQLFEKGKTIDGYIYLRYTNVVNEELFGPGGKVYGLTEIQEKFAGRNKVYTNGASEVYR